MSEPDSVDHRLLAAHDFALVAAEHRNRLPPGIASQIVAGGVLEDSADLMPLLIELRVLESGQIDRLLECLERDLRLGDAPTLSALLVSDSSARRLAEHLSTVQRIRGPGEESAWLRLHDPRVWLHLPRVLRNMKLSGVFGPVARWTVWLSGSWYETLPPEVQPVHLQPGICSVKEWAALERVGAVNRVLARKGWLNREHLEARSPLIDGLLVRGQTRHGLSRMADLVAYASLGASVHPRFDEARVAVEAIESQARERGGAEPGEDDCIVDALEAIEPEAWALARQELERESEVMKESAT